MSDLEVRSPIPAARSTPDLVDEVLARARTGSPGPPPAAPARDALTARAPSANANAFPEIEARKPPGPHAKPAAPPPLKGPAAATPPRGPGADAAAAAAQAAKAAAMKAAALKAAAVKAGEKAGAAPGAAGQDPARRGADPSPQAAPPAAPPAPTAPPTATSLIDDTASWLPEEPDRRAAFLQVFRYWHAQVRPEFAHKARPAFLFLVTALPVMVKARDSLTALNLWEPPGEHSRQARDLHPAWKKYCEFLPRATQALQELDDYRHLSLLTALDDLNARVIKAEKKFREGLPTGRR